MAQIQFPNPAGQDAGGKDLPPIEYTGLSFGSHGGVETFLVIEDGHLTIKSKAPTANAAPASETGNNTSGSGRTGPQIFGNQIEGERKFGTPPK